MTVRANGISTTAICASCGSTLDVANPEVRLITEARERSRQPPIAIGTRGTLVGTLWEIVGFQTRTDLVHGGSWDEYLLFNPWRGFRFLAQDDEDWTLYCMLRQDVTDPNDFDGQRYVLRNSSMVRTEYVLGEFYWRAKVGDEAAVNEFEGQSQPTLLSREQSQDEIVWSRGVKLTAATVSAGFGQTPEAGPSATTAPSARSTPPRNVGWVALFALLALILAYAIPFGNHHGSVVFSRTFHTNADNEGQTLTSDPFEIPGKGGNARISAYSNVSNNWMELSFTLVGPNDVTFAATSSIEYYFGTDSDGDWTEGSRSTSATFKSVPGGIYRLLIEPYAGAYHRDPRNSSSQKTNADVAFTVTVTRHVTDAAAFWIALVLLSLYPIWHFIARLWLGNRTSRQPQPRISP